MTIQNMVSYIKKLASIRQHVSRIGQFETPFEIVFREPPPSKKSSAQDKKAWWNRKILENKYKQKNIICIMCDGEFYILKDPQSLRFKRFAQIWTLGKLDGQVNGRLVRDEQISQKRQREQQQRHNLEQQQQQTASSSYL